MNKINIRFLGHKRRFIYSFIYSELKKEIMFGEIHFRTKQKARNHKDIRAFKKIVKF